MSEPSVRGLPARGRVLAVLGLLLAAALLLGAAVAPWWDVAVDAAPSAQIAGSHVAGGLVPIALTLAVLGLALSLARGVLARALAVVAVLLAALLAVHLALSADASAAIADAVASVTGITTSEHVATATAAPALAWAGTAVAAACGVWALATAGRWQRRTRGASRFERVESGLAWDALDDGDDPTA